MHCHRFHHGVMHVTYNSKSSVLFTLKIFFTFFSVTWQYVLLVSMTSQRFGRKNNLVWSKEHRLSIRVAIKKVQKQGKYKLSKAGHFAYYYFPCEHRSLSRAPLVTMCSRIFREANFETRNSIINEYNSFLELLFTYRLPNP